ncbi:hypothetical protein N0O92_01475 [Alkalihalobacillus sp. MEB130]|nr:hypothetical protein [Alkalihalobacillus sp. MEB130]MDT8858881.1 hypothetical protein [Alkalihalobacillus sp. MEB130]
MILLKKVQAWFVKQMNTNELTYYDVMHFKAIGYKEMYKKSFPRQHRY